MQIEHVVVLMLENNSFDRMLGSVPGVDGVDPANLRSNPDLSGKAVVQSETAMRRMLCDPADPNSKTCDPEHDLADVLMEQMKGPNQGFVTNFERHYSECTPDAWAEVMKYYGLGSLPVLHQLAQSFVVCDQWFSSLPGPTWPNRFFVHSGTSLGHVDMPEGIFHPALHLYNQETVYDRLDDAGKSWAVYYGDVPQVLTMTHILLNPNKLRKLHKMDQFFADVTGAEADFPEYCFIEPAYFGAEQNDQHPPSDVLRGEVLLAQVYNAIQNNEALWEKTLMVVLYDEHGGFYDHVVPPASVPPDGNVKDFSFAQYGIRTPAVLISPWLEKQVISDEFDHTSLLRFVSDMWGLGPLGARTAVAKSFATSWKVAGALRTDVPVNIPEPTALPNLEGQMLNPNQLALVGFSRFLETKTVALAAEAGPAAAEAMTLQVGQRVLWSTENDTHGEVAVQRVDAFLELALRTAPAPGARGGVKGTAKKKAPAKTAGKAAAKKGAAAKKTSSVKAKPVAAKGAAAKKTPAKKTLPKKVPAKKAGASLVKAAAKAIAKKGATVLAAKAIAAGLKKAAKKRSRQR